MGYKSRVFFGCTSLSVGKYFLLVNFNLFVIDFHFPIPIRLVKVNTKEVNPQIKIL